MATKKAQDDQRAWHVGEQRAMAITGRAVRKYKGQ